MGGHMSDRWKKAMVYVHASILPQLSLREELG